MLRCGDYVCRGMEGIPAANCPSCASCYAACASERKIAGISGSRSVLLPCLAASVCCATYHCPFVALGSGQRNPKRRVLLVSFKYFSPWELRALLFFLTRLSGWCFHAVPPGNTRPLFCPPHHASLRLPVLPGRQWDYKTRIHNQNELLTQLRAMLNNMLQQKQRFKDACIDTEAALKVTDVTRRAAMTSSQSRHDVITEVAVRGLVRIAYIRLFCCCHKAERARFRKSWVQVRQSLKVCIVLSSTRYCFFFVALLGRAARATAPHRTPHHTTPHHSFLVGGP